MTLICERLRCKFIVGDHAHASLPKMNDLDGVISFNVADAGDLVVRRVFVRVEYR
jgi:hypothetical protein